MVHFELEADSDIPEIRRLTESAFSESDLGYHGEADLVDMIRTQSDNSVSIVATCNQEVVGHILFSPAIIRNRDQAFHGWGLGPMSVDPKYQRQGIGSGLVKRGLEQIAGQGGGFTIVAGHPEYYRRFGFESAGRYSLLHGFEGMPQDIFFVRFNSKSLADSCRNGLAFYHSAFGPQHQSNPKPGF